MTHKLMDSKFTEHDSSVIGLLQDKSTVYVICRSEGAAGEVRQRLKEFEPQKLTSHEAFRVIDDNLKGELHVSSASIIRLAHTAIKNVGYHLTQRADGTPTNAYISPDLAALAQQPPKRGFFSR